jgi:transposase
MFCAIFYVMRTGVSWRDLPEVYGPWRTVYTRFKRWPENGLFWRVLYELQRKKRLRMEIVWVDSASHKVHRHPRLRGDRLAGAPKKRDPESG